ncbi:MAG TPA: hypothetical protein VK498_05260, partial [Ferruginibacter sp.]|nr:hypothetical protein [Ferruginibacter sp.]
KTWKQITNGIASTHFTRCLRADKNRNGLLYCGTEYGMYISYDDGNSWKPFQLNLPMVPITDLTIKDNDLVVATQGRSFWVLDDLTLVQQADQDFKSKKIYAFPVNPSYAMGGSRNVNARNAGFNPPNGAVINYYLKEAPDSALVSITVTDARKKLIRTYSTIPKPKEEKLEVNPGMNQFVWNMIYAPSETIEGLILWNGNVPGPKAAPGQYFYKIKSGKDSAEGSFIIRQNPNYKLSQGDADAKFTFLLTVRDKFTEMQTTIKNIREIRKQLNDFTARLPKDSSRDVKEVKAAADSILKKITSIEEALYQTKAKSPQDVLNYPIRLNDKISGLYDYAASGNTAPTKQVLEVYNDLAAQADIQLNKFKQVLDLDLKAFNQLVKQKTFPVIGIIE